MWAVDPPLVTVSDVAKACALGIRDEGLRGRVVAAAAELAANSVTLQTHVHGQSLHATVAAVYPVAGLSDAELKGLYKSQVARLGSKARPLYSKMLDRALFGLCSYCQYGAADTLDHFVPVTVVPTLAIDPWNLVPSCIRCNKLLLNDFHSTAGKQMLHPYAVPASVPPSARWLRARVYQAQEPVVDFYADPDAALPDLLRERIINQFNACRLGALYRVVAARELAGVRRKLSDDFPGAQPDPVRRHLRELSEAGMSVDPNDRRGVMYEALAGDDWFVSTGYEMPAVSAS